jgi:hypothetical protein
MQTDWDDSHVEQTRLIGLRAPLRVPNDKKPPFFDRVFGRINKYLNHISDDKKKSIDIIFETLRHIKKKNKNIFTVDLVISNTQDKSYENTNENNNKEYEESMKRLINITSYKKYIKKMYYVNENYDTTINEDPHVSLEKLIETLRDIVKEDTYIDYIRNEYKRKSISKEQIYEELIEHLENIKSSSLTINKRDETFEQSGGNNKQYKEILGKRRRIYKIKGSRKEHVKYKGELIPVSDYKKLVKK